MNNVGFSESIMPE